MTISSIQAFVPSGPDFNRSLELFNVLGFVTSWQGPGYAGLEKDGQKFILQDYNERGFAENLMFNVRIDDATALYKFLQEEKIAERFAVRVTPPKMQPYGLEVNLIDIAGVCWHFVSEN